MSANVGSFRSNMFVCSNERAGHPISPAARKQILDKTQSYMLFITTSYPLYFKFYLRLGHVCTTMTTTDVITTKYLVVDTARERFN